jgi:opacity protein-like surface antigen
MKNLFYLFALAAILFTASCASNETAESDTVKQSEIYQTLSVTYDAGDKELSATASFRFGGGTGTTLHLTDPAKVTFDGEEMRLENDIFNGTYYSIDRQEDFKGQYSFVFTDGDKKTYTNSFTYAPISITDYPGDAEKTTGIMVKWDLPLKNNERVYLYVEDNKGNTSWVSTEIVGATSIELTPDKLKDLFPGSVNIYLTREVNSSLTDATHLGGKVFLKYISPKVGLNLNGEAPETAKKDHD